MSSKTSPPTLRLRLTRGAEGHVRRGHPWIYADSIRTANRDGETGEPAVIFDRHDRFLAVGLFDGESPIRVRVLQVGKPQIVDRPWLQGRFADAVNRRRDLVDDATNGVRLIHGESDGWPALVLDGYGDIAVLKLYSAAWLPRLAELTEICREVVAPKRLVLRLSRNLQNVARSTHGLEDGELLFGPPLDGIPTFLENGLRFEADVERGQKTGFFLDQRENRRRVGELASGRDVLNAFSFSGGFSLYAARGGARSVTDMDISRHALAAAERNFELNRAVPAVADCAYEQVQGDVFRRLDEPGPSYDLVVLDPPSLARRKAERAKALGAYGRLAAMGIRRLRPGGILFSASCSAQVPTDDFFQAVRKAARASGRRFRELETTGHAVDHPSTFAEAAYLKGIYLEFS